VNKILESAIIVTIPEAESVVRKWREKYDRVALLGIPAHITLLYPFKSPPEINESIIDKLRLLFKTINSFSFSLTTIGTFPNVIFLSPYPKNFFIDITKKLASLFPENPPFGGKFPEINPHLTIGQFTDKDNFKEILNNILKEINPKLPINAKAIEAKLMVENSDQTWSELIKFPFR
jgi:2'-5' RNA ligase